MIPSDLKSARASMGLAQKPFAEMLGVSQAQVCRWERGVNPIPKWVDKLLECLRERGEKR